MHTSQWEELFEVPRGNTPWAHFETPERFHLVAKRLFSYRLFPTIYWDDEMEKEEDGEDEREEEEGREGADLIKQVLAQAKNINESPALFEKDKTIIVTLLESIKDLNALLGQINARKLQYQKG